MVAPEGGRICIRGTMRFVYSRSKAAAAIIMQAEDELVVICSGTLPLSHQAEPGPSAGPAHEPP